MKATMEPALTKMTMLNTSASDMEERINNSNQQKCTVEKDERK